MNKILVVDDNLASLKQIGAQLAECYDISLAKSGALALQICMQEKPDLILLDIEMPEMDGFETIKRLRLNRYLGSIPVIFLTGNHDTETEVRGLQSGARDFITKPVEKSILIHRIELHLRFSSYQTHLENTVAKLSESVALSFAELIECRDENTGEHVARTSKYVGMLGKNLITRGLFPEELTPTDLEMMVRAAPLHDIGKIAISDRILLKPDRLDDEEFTIMKRHTVIGGELLENMLARTPTQHYLQYAKMIALSHHERYDGKGYPNGLAGDDIPLCGRIMAVADVYDALVDNRVYRRGMSHTEARRIILDGKNKNFDGRVVEAFEDINEQLAKAAQKT
ncbi:MAG: response regulator [Spirochaetaceae bacterium]|jgi:putative two-component system response regulator|nr:response regulator [Spirochaetaceae bacterium]